MEFEIKKLSVETLSEYLHAIRLELGFSFEYVCEQTGIAPKYVQALETGNFKALPESVYVAGFLRKLAAAYSIESADLIKQFYRERELDVRDVHESMAKRWRGMLIGSPGRKTAFIGGMVSVGAMLLFVVFQVWMVGGVPKLEVQTPLAGNRYQTGLIEVSGKASPGSEVSFNNQVVYAGSDGTFSGTISFLSGAQTVKVTAKSRLGKVNQKDITFLVSDNLVAQTYAGPPTPALVLGITVEEGVVASVSFMGRIVPVSSTAFFSGLNRMTVDTSNAGKTRVSINNGPAVTLGKAGEVLTNIPFAPTSAHTVSAADLVAKQN